MFNEKKTYTDIDGKKHTVGGDGLGARVTLLVTGLNERIPQKLVSETDVVIVVDNDLRRVKFSVMRNRLDSFHGEGTSISKIFEGHFNASMRLKWPGQVLISDSLTHHKDKIISDIRNLYAFRRYYLLL